MLTKLELGCGNNKKNGYYGVDISKTGAVDQVIDLNKNNWDLPSNHFDSIRAIDVFEHIENPISFIEEVHRISKHNARLIIRGPHFSSQNWHDPTHKRLLGSRTFDNFTNRGRFQFYSKANFEIKSIDITFEWSGILVKKIGSYIANKHVTFYERSFIRNILPATNITFHLRACKNQAT